MCSKSISSKPGKPFLNVLLTNDAATTTYLPPPKHKTTPSEVLTHHDCSLSFKAETRQQQDGNLLWVHSDARLVQTDPLGAGVSPHGDQNLRSRRGQESCSGFLYTHLTSLVITTVYIHEFGRT